VHSKNQLMKREKARVLETTGASAGCMKRAARSLPKESMSAANNAGTREKPFPTLLIYCGLTLELSGARLFARPLGRKVRPCA
jgi:hypothetical protein